MSSASTVSDSRQVHIQIGNIVREARLKKGMSQLELADLLGYDSPQFVSLFERGISKVPPETLGRLVVILDIAERKMVQILVQEYEGKLVREIRRGKLLAQKSK